MYEKIKRRRKQMCKNPLSVGPEFRELPVPRTPEEIDEAIRRRER